MRVTWYGTSLMTMTGDFPFPFLDDVRSGPKSNSTPLPKVTVDDSLPAHDDAASGEIRTGDQFEQVLQ